MLAGVCATNFDVEGIAAVAGADDDGLLSELAERLQDGLAQLFEDWNVLRRTRLSMWLATAVALLSNSATVKCGVNLKFVIII